ncbi:MAG: hypothetical protein KGL39_21290 [Patescibacteria group bacterium]|nr:hypothetical protein [Patescibacteria group bacterium]
MRKTAAALLVAVLANGCAYMHSATTRSTDPKTGIVTETTTARAYALFDSQAALTKFRNQSSSSTNAMGTWAPGTYASGLNDNATSTNAVQVLNALSGVLGKIPW